MPWRRRSRGLLPAILWLTLGCAGKDHPVPVAGTLMLDGQPVKGATITFLPEARGGRPAHGLTLADGSFQLSTFQPDDGALPGNYKVMVEGNETPETAPSFTDQQEAMQAARRSQPPKKGTLRYPIPASYSDPSKTTLRQKVPPEGKVVIELTSK